MPIDAESLRAKLPARDVELAVYDWGGNGPPILLAHANGFCGPLWDPVARRLRSEYRVFAYDHRAQGDSPVPDGPDAEIYAWNQFGDDLLALSVWIRDELGLDEPLYAVGHSFGGTSVLHAMSQAPERFQRACLLDPVLKSNQRVETARSHAHKLVKSARERRDVWPSRPAILEAWKDKALFRSWTPESLALYIEHGFRDRSDGQVELKCAPAIEAAVFESTWSGDIFELAASIKRPTLLVHAEKGHFPVDYVQSVVAQAPQIDLTRAPFDHRMLMEAPDSIAELILDFGSDRKAA